MLKHSQSFVGKKLGRPDLMNYGYEDSMATKTLSIPHNGGRWPSNVILDGSEVVRGLFPETVSLLRNPKIHLPCGTGMFFGGSYEGNTYDDSGSASRFFKVIPCE